MSHKLDKLKYKKLENGNFEILENFNFEIKIKEKTKKFTIPKGFITDFASVPKIFQNWIRKEGKSRLASTTHDYFYRTQKVSKFRADLEFLHFLAHDKVGFIKRNLMFLTVFLFGFFAYYKNSKN